MKHLLVAALLCCLAPLAATDSALPVESAHSHPAPHVLLAATSDSQPFNLEDYRGQVTVLVFYDDSFA